MIEDARPVMRPGIHKERRTDAPTELAELEDDEIEDPATLAEEEQDE